MTHALDLPLALETLQSGPIAIIILDQDDHISWHNQKFIEHVGATSDICTGKPLEAVSEGLKDLLGADGAEAIDSDTPFQVGQRWYRCWQHIVKNGEGMSQRILYIVDATIQHRLQIENRRLEKELATKNTHDKSTGLLNRQGLMQILETQVTRSRRYKNPLSLIRMDIVDDGNCAINEDELTAIGHILNDQLRWADVAGRIENEKFMLILPETSRDAAALLAEKITENLTGEMAEDHVALDKANICYGISDWVKGDDLGKLMQRAEQALETAKNSDTAIVAN